jgi:predicted Zn-dependent protease
MSDPTLPQPDQSALQTEHRGSQESRAQERKRRTRTTSSSTSERHSERSRSRSRSESYSRGKVGKYSFWSLPWRRAVAFWNYWKPKKLLSGSVARSLTVLNSMLIVEGTELAQELADERYVVRTWPSRKTLWNPLWWFSNALTFALRWLVSRRILSLLLAGPAVVVALSLFAAMSAGNRIPPSTEGIVYKRMLSGGPQQAKLALDALIRIDPDNAEIAYDRALLEQAMGNIENTRLIMGELATIAKSPIAAMWLANDVGDVRQFFSWPKEKMLTYHSWLQVAVENDPEDPVQRRMLADVRAMVGNKRGAYEALLPIADMDTDTSFMFYFLQKDLGFTDEALARGERLTRVLRSRLQDAPSDHGVRLQLVLLLASTEQFVAAKELIESGLTYASTVEAQLGMKRAKSDLLLAEAKSIARTDSTPAGLLTRMSRLLEAVAVDAGNPELKFTAAHACFEAAESADEGLLVLREAIVENVDSETAYFIQGTIALNRGSLAEATQQLELAAQQRELATEQIEVASRQNPNIANMYNNLAHALCFGEPPNLQRALQMANTANALQPNHSYLRETRGQIYLKLQQFTPAIADLEVALNAEELRTQVHESLVQAYEAVGQTEIAQRHRELASQGR